MNILRRLPLSRLLLLCGGVTAMAAAVAAIALGLTAGPVPPPKPLDQAVHDALAAPPIDGLSARVQLTNHLLEGAGLSTGGQASGLSSSPLLSGSSGRLWVASDGRARLELQSEKGDTQILYDGRTVSLYDASTNTLYRYTPQRHGAGGHGTSPSRPDATTRDHSHVPSLQQIQQAIERLDKHVLVSGATPTDIAGQPAYTVRVSPRENGGLIGGAELSWDAVHGVPLRLAVYARASSSPVIELAASEVSYGPIAASTLDFPVPADAKVHTLKLPARLPAAGTHTSANTAGKPHLSTHGKGLDTIVLVEHRAKTPHGEGSSRLAGLPKVDINGASASELTTPLGTLLSFERSGIQYLLAGSVTPGTIEAFARSI